MAEIFHGDNSKVNIEIEKPTANVEYGNYDFSQRPHLGSGYKPTSSLKKAYMAEKPDEETMLTIEEYRKLTKERVPFMVVILDVIPVNDAFCVVSQCFVTDNLRQVIEGQRGQLFPEATIVIWLLQLGFALEYLHDKKIIHREVKCENVFIVSSESGQSLKLGDFGLVKRRRLDTLIQLDRDDAITVAPELWEGKPFSEKSDIWSLGVVIYELAMSRFPAFRNDEKPVWEAVVSSWTDRRIPSNYNVELINLVEKLLSNNPEERPSARQITNDTKLMGIAGQVKKMHEEEEAKEQQKNTSGPRSEADSGYASSASATFSSSSGQTKLYLPTTHGSQPESASKSADDRPRTTGSHGISEEKRIGIQNQLILILHAHKCAKRDAIAKSLAAAGLEQSEPSSSSADSGIESKTSTSSEQTQNLEPYQCKVAYCQRMKDVITHLRGCRNETTCTYKSCISTRQIILHWQTCTDNECPVCKDVRMLSTLSKPVFDVGKPKQTSSSISTGASSSTEQQTVAAPVVTSYDRSPNVMRTAKAYSPLSVKPIFAWQSNFELGVRQKVIDKFGDDLMRNGMFNERDRVMQFTQQAEAEIFGKAVSRDRYYFLLAERLYTAQKELLHTGGNAETPSNLDIPEQCPICFLEVVKLGCSTRRLKCKHVFHMTCINRWLREHPTCPVCRTDV